MNKSLLPALLFFFGTPLSLPILAGESCDLSSCSQAATTPAPPAGGNKTSSAPKPQPAPTRRPAPAPSKFLFM